MQTADQPAEPVIEATPVGFHPDADGVANADALQRAVDRGGTIRVDRPGTYRIARTVLIGSDTRLIFGHGVTLRKTDEAGGFSHVLLNRGALTRSWDRRISIEGLHLEVAGIDSKQTPIYGLRGQVSLSYVQDAAVRGFRCLDLGSHQFAIQVCTFEDLTVEDVIIKGRKDGVHLGRGRRFRISRGVFETYDDAIALNAHDYAVSNPQLGWIEHGLIEDCHDLAAADGHQTGFFCRVLAGSWTDWRKGMEVRRSDSVVHGGRVYRVCSEPDGKVYTSHTPPEHDAGRRELDGIPWVPVQDDAQYSAGVRHVTFRHIHLHKPRIGLSLHFDDDKYSRSLYPGAEPPQQVGLLLEDVRVLYDRAVPLINVLTPLDAITLRDCVLGHGGVTVRRRGEARDERITALRLLGCQFAAEGEFTLLDAEDPNWSVHVHTSDSLWGKASPQITGGANAHRSGDLPQASQ